MASYSASMIVKDLAGKPCLACGSFGNIAIDGRLSISRAIEIAEESFKKESKFQNSEYLGFVIEKTSRFVEYRNPSIIGNKEVKTFKELER
ncbi:hypothetical protein FDG95_gp417 [Pectobacterium phage vB_PcaM_CBB]|uniref:Uncharacterized protein n=1 Tax=Pectobacterium phage vB_PcaM_CBB TaxID=2772511 RepID=A0A1L2CVS7_9CAUD|nr:hypothetical protein FDG95_gp009 [Pectobacterium phage vB_PcaM_CBB]YP_009595102.1 hypothetical protein FDG95_gp417 [Pectobacterium phage vB_PcaM_CBB]AMM43574.1 hypothetical protein CBB_562 [Pectobacterium phage vB_PcaM_CBB]AMM44125.1 hypothetical protein CBB_9 [Pectobacterium phage vB_PcaM_CBB]